MGKLRVAVVVLLVTNAEEEWKEPMHSNRYGETQPDWENAELHRLAAVVVAVAVPVERRELPVWGLLEEEAEDIPRDRHNREDTDTWERHWRPARFGQPCKVGILGTFHKVVEDRDTEPVSPWASWLNPVRVLDHHHCHHPPEVAVVLSAVPSQDAWHKSWVPSRDLA